MGINGSTEVSVAIGTYGRIYEGYLANAEDDVEGAVPVMIKTVIGQYYQCVLCSVCCL